MFAFACLHWCPAGTCGQHRIPKGVAIDGLDTALGGKAAIEFASDGAG